MKSFLLVAVFTALSQAVAGTASGGRHQGPDFTPNHRFSSRVPAKSSKQPVIPKLKTTPEILGLVNDPALDRDSCGSSNFGDRTLWTCRDTQLFYPNGSVIVPSLITSTASWTNYASDGGPMLENLSSDADKLNTTVLKQYGKNAVDQAFFPVDPAYFCSPPSGGCSDGTRFALWPDLPPMVTSSSLDSHITAYTWIRQSHIRQDLSTVTDNPATTLYRVDYTRSQPSGDKNVLPYVTTLDESFWAENEISFGNYGNVVRDGIAYLFGQANGITALAKVSVSQVEDKSAYQYWVNGEWTEQMPQIDADGINITNANAGGQGTYYYSEPWQSFVWIGGQVAVGSDMYITTSPDPTGPWIPPIHFYTGINGDYFLGAYSIQANPALTTDPSKNEIYITYTKNDLDRDGINVYSSPLVYVQWE